MPIVNSYRASTLRSRHEADPQNIRSRGRDTVVQDETLGQENRTDRRLVRALAASPLRDVFIERPNIVGPVRVADLSD